jgi:hypothetical protein
VFDYYEVLEEGKVKLVSNQIKGRASAWWEQLQVNQQRRGKSKIKEWSKMNKKIKEKSISFNYMQTLFKNLHNLQQVGSVDEYTKAFYQLIARVYLNESEERMMEGILVA